MKGAMSPSNTFFNENSQKGNKINQELQDKLILPSLQGNSSSKVGSAAHQSRLNQLHNYPVM